MQCLEHSLSIKKVLKANKLKRTPARLALLDIFEHAKKPLSIKEVEAKFKRHNVDIVTLYRNVEAFINLGILLQIRLKDRQAYYELANLAHHHHIVCNNCARIEDVIATENLAEVEKHITKTTKFKNINHALEFFGLCAACSKK